MDDEHDTRTPSPFDDRHLVLSEGSVCAVVVGSKRYFVRGETIEEVRARAMRAARDDGEPTIIRMFLGPLYGDERPEDDAVVLDADEWQPRTAVPRGPIPDISTHASRNLENLRQGRDEGYVDPERYREQAREYMRGDAE